MRTAGMVFCRCCGKEIHESAPACPQCGGLQQALAPPAQKKPGEPGLWVPIVGLTCAILGLLACMGDGEFDRDTTVGIVTFDLIGIVFGIVSIRNQAAGKKMAIAAAIVASISLLCLLGMRS
jgi:hypothetical protein